MPSAELRREIEDLALRLVVGETDGGNGTARWMPALEKIRERALREQVSGVSATAALLLEKLRDPRTPEDAWNEGIAALKQKLETWLKM